MFSSGIVALAGSRALPSGGASVVSNVVQSLQSSGCSLVCGCCVGVDEIVIRVASPSALRVMAAFGPGGHGSCFLSAVNAIDNHYQLDGLVSWWSGGGPGVPLRVRLARRTLAVVSAASAGLVVFPSSPTSRGSWLAARLAVGRALPVVAFPLGFSSAELPYLGSGQWLPVYGSGVWALAWQWVSEDFLNLFD
jgi:predicted Rossmann fold nucleotide-binding protein DprA/Smf involved in DNA uptake